MTGHMVKADHVIPLGFKKVFRKRNRAQCLSLPRLKEVGFCMLKSVELADLELGMFVHRMEGGWFDHPFWASKFLIEDEQKLQTLRESRLRGVIIDTAKGKDVGQIKVRERAAAKAAPCPSQSRIKAIKQRSTREQFVSRPVTLEQELGKASAIADKAKDNLQRAFKAARLGKALDVKTVEPVVHDVLASVRRNPHAFSGLMRCKLKNELVFQHALSVSALMVSLGSKMKLPRETVLECGLAGLFLDIGVNYLPQTISPPGGDFRKLAPKIWQQHVQLGHRALLNDDDLPETVLDACLHHHERMDGSGFPHGIAGTEISLAGRMAAICDTFDFLLSKTEKTAALDPAVAIQEMRKMEGAFDEDVLRHFIESVGLYPVGSFVLLKSEKLAMVIDEDFREHTKPIVQAFYSTATNERILPHRIELAYTDKSNQIDSIADLSQYDLPDPAQLREMVFLSAHKVAA